MTAICYIGIELSARTQYFLLAAEIAALAPVRGGRAGQGLLRRLRAASTSRLTGSTRSPSRRHHRADRRRPPGGVHLLGLGQRRLRQRGIRGQRQRPRAAAVMSTILLVLIYVVVATAAQAYAGTTFLKHHGDDVLSALGGPGAGLAAGQDPDHRGAHLGLGIDADDDPADRQDHAVDGPLRLDPQELRHGSTRAILTPDVSTLVMGAVSLVWTLVHHQRQPERALRLDHRARLPDRLLLRVTGFACAIYYRKEIFKSLKNFIMVGVAPFLGGAMLTLHLRQGVLDYKTTPANYSGDSWFGIGPPVAIGVGWATPRRRPAGVRQLRLPEVLQAQVGDGRPPDSSREPSRAERP